MAYHTNSCRWNCHGIGILLLLRITICCRRFALHLRIPRYLKRIKEVSTRAEFYPVKKKTGLS
jgi:hypothetical protein